MDQFTDIVLAHDSGHEVADAVREAISVIDGPFACAECADFWETWREEDRDHAEAIPVDEGVVDALRNDLGVGLAITHAVRAIDAGHFDFDAECDVWSGPLLGVTWASDGINAKALARGVSAPVLKGKVEVRFEDSEDDLREFSFSQCSANKGPQFYAKNSQ